MAAATDKFLYVGDPGTATTLSAPGYTQGDTTINVGSTTNFPSASGVIFAIDRAQVVNGEEVRIDGTYCVFSGLVTSGTSIGSLTLEYGTPQDYSAGALTRVYITVSALHNKRLVDGILNHADQDGTLKTGAVDIAAVLADSVVTTAKVNNGAITPEKLVTGTGTSWTPTTYTNPGSAGGTNTFFYRNVAGVKEFWGKTNTLTTSGSGFQSATGDITLPVGFFSTIQSCTIGLIPATSIFMSANINTITTSTVSLYVWQGSGTSGGAQVYVHVRGT